MRTELLKYSKKSHRKKIKIPRQSTDLAEFLGIEFGDGGINNQWQIVITLNAEKDIEYSLYIKKLAKKLFNIDSIISKREKRTLKVVFTSISLVDFLVEKGAVRGNKIKQRLDIPGWILKNNRYKKAFIRGLIDTDGCLYIHNHCINDKNYRNIGFCFTSWSYGLLNSVADIFRDFGIKPHISDKNRRIYLYGDDSVLKYLRIFGSSNPRITNLYDKWKGAGVV